MEAGVTTAQDASFEQIETATDNYSSFSPQDHLCWDFGFPLGHSGCNVF
jgi:hypothetical protein